MKAENCLFFQPAKASKTATRYWSRQVESLGVTAVQAMVMNFLGEEDGVLSCELGARTGLDSAILMGLVDRLEKMELVDREPVLDDHCAVSICLTEKDRALTLQSHELMIEANKNFFRGSESLKKGILRDLLKMLKKEEKLQNELKE